MFGTRQVSAPGGGRSVLALSVLALLALGCFPVLAHADSSEKQYTDAPPTVTGGKAPSHGEPPANKSTARNGGSTKDGKGRSNNSHSSEKGATGAGSPPGSGGSGQNPGNPSGNGSGGAGEAPGTANPASSTGGGSSPLVPILIAIVGLAAISVAVVVVKQRRRGGSSASPASPEAG